MKVWIENPFDNLPCEGFRPQRYFLMAEAFARAGCGCVCWTADFNHTTKAARSFREPVELADNLSIKLVHEPPYSSNISLRRVWCHRRYAAEWLEKAEAEAAAHGAPDIVIASSPPLSAAGAASVFAHRHGAMFVIDVMDAWPETFERVFPRFLLSPLRAAARRNYLSTDMITVVADRYAALVRGYGYTGEIRRFYHGIPMGPLSGPASGALSAAGRAIHLAYIGNLGRTYDLETVVEAVASARERGEEIYLHIAGKGGAEKRLRALCAKRGVSGRVAFYGYLGESDLAALFAKCDIGVVPMEERSFVGMPYKMADYAKAGLAIVSSLGGESAALAAGYGAIEEYESSSPSSFLAAVGRISRRLAEAKEGARRMAVCEFDAVRIYDGYAAAVLAKAESTGRRG